MRARTGRPVDPVVQLGRDARNQPCAWTMDSHGMGWLHANNCPGLLICEVQRPPPPRDLPPPTYTWEDWAAVARNNRAAVDAAARASCGFNADTLDGSARSGTGAAGKALADVAADGGTSGGYAGVARV